MLLEFFKKNSNKNPSPQKKSTIYVSQECYTGVLKTFQERVMLDNRGKEVAIGHDEYDVRERLRGKIMFEAACEGHSVSRSNIDKIKNKRKNSRGYERLRLDSVLKSAFEAERIEGSIEYVPESQLQKQDERMQSLHCILKKLRLLTNVWRVEIPEDVKKTSMVDRIHKEQMEHLNNEMEKVEKLAPMVKMSYER